MRLICPNCATQYDVADSAIPARGRSVKCGACSTDWFVAPPTPAAVDLSMPEVESAVETTDVAGQKQPDASDASARETQDTFAAPDADSDTFDPETLRNLLSQKVDRDTDVAPIPAATPVEQSDLAAPQDVPELETDDTEDDINFDDMLADLEEDTNAPEADAESETESVEGESDPSDTSELDADDDLDAALSDLVDEPEAVAEPAQAEPIEANPADTTPDEPLPVAPEPVRLTLAERLNRARAAKSSDSTDFVTFSDAAQDSTVEDQIDAVTEALDDTVDAVADPIADALDDIDADDAEEAVISEDTANTIDAHDQTDFAIPPVPSADVRAFADDAFDAMRARRAARREERDVERDDVGIAPLAAAIEEDIQKDVSILDQLRDQIDEATPDTNDATVDESAAPPVDQDIAQSTGAEDALDPETAAEVAAAVSSLPRRERPKRPDADSAATSSLARRERPARPGRPAAPSTTEMPTADVGDASDTTTAVKASSDTGSKAGLGFMVSVVMAVIAVAIYAFAGDIAAIVPAMAGPLDGYVSSINNIRMSLDQSAQSVLSSILGG